VASSGCSRFPSEHRAFVTFVVVPDQPPAMAAGLLACRIVGGLWMFSCNEFEQIRPFQVFVRWF
jgi:hypothetical protein